MMKRCVIQNVLLLHTRYLLDMMMWWWCFSLFTVVWWCVNQRNHHNSQPTKYNKLKQQTNTSQSIFFRYIYYSYI